MYLTVVEVVKDWLCSVQASGLVQGTFVRRSCRSVSRLSGFSRVLIVIDSTTVIIRWDWKCLLFWKVI
jgi:hypothetical protein